MSDDYVDETDDGALADISSCNPTDDEWSGEPCMERWQSVLDKITKIRTEAVEAFVAYHRGRAPRQRDAAGLWAASMGVTVGGSELAALLGQDPYKTAYDVAVSKLDLLRGRGGWNGGGAACWWGVLFEDVMGLVLEADLGGPVLGDDICIKGQPGHRNSPDGYIVARVVVTRADTPRARPKLVPWTARTGGVPERVLVLLLETKCPLTRAPTGAVPRQYRPQVQSGLGVSPCADAGLFVDAVFRKCSLAQVMLPGEGADGAPPSYDRDYHSRDDGRYEGETPVARGLVFICAPRCSGAGTRQGDPESADYDAAVVASEIRRGAGECVSDDGLVDLGLARYRTFERALGLLNARRFRAHLCRPAMNGALPDYAGGLAEARAACIDGLEVFAVLPWKLLVAHYVIVAREPGFIAGVMPLIDDLHAAVAAAAAAEDAGGDPYRVLGDRLGASIAPRAPPRSVADLQADADDIAMCAALEAM